MSRTHGIKYELYRVAKDDWSLRIAANDQLHDTVYWVVHANNVSVHNQVRLKIRAGRRAEW